MKEYKPKKPVRSELLRVGAPQIMESEIKEIVEVIKTGWWVSGPRTKKLSDKFKEYIGCKYATPVTSGTAALHLALDCMGIGPGDEVITTPVTYPATVNVIEYVGAKPVFVDVERETFNIDSKKIPEAITPKTKAIIPVHIAGHPCDMNEINAIAEENKLYVIEDAAHAVEAEYRDNKIGNISDITCFSFDVTKNVAAGMGGMLTTNCSDWAKKAMNRSHLGVLQTKNSEPYETIYPGFKYDMTEFAAAIALHQLARVEANLKIREQHWKTYENAFKECEELILLKEKKNIKHSRHLFMMLLNPQNFNVTRREFMDALIEENIEARIRFTAIHLHEFYRKKYGFKKGLFPNSEFISENVICLPLSPVMEKHDAQSVIDGVLRVLEFYR